MTPAKSTTGTTRRQSAALTGTVTRVGARPRVSLTQRAAAVADLKVVITGGKAGAPVNTALAVTLNTKTAAGLPLLVDDTAGARPVRGTRSEQGYVFANVQFPAPGPSSRRTFRITNVRANATRIGGGLGLPGQIVAVVSSLGPTPIRLSNAEQAVALVARPT